MCPHIDIRLLSWKKTLCVFYRQDPGGTGDCSISSCPAVAEFTLLDPALPAEVPDGHTGNTMKKSIALTTFQGRQGGKEDEDVPQYHTSYPHGI